MGYLLTRSMAIRRKQAHTLHLDTEIFVKVKSILRNIIRILRLLYRKKRKQKFHAARSPELS